MNEINPITESDRLEQLWAGNFGNEYSVRNREVSEKRKIFWAQTLSKYPVKSVLEVGCNVGGNLRWISDLMAPEQVYGVDINKEALATIRRALPTINAVWSSAKELPFRDQRFEMVFTAGVLIHQPDCSLAAVMDEIVRCSFRYVLCMEYYSEKAVEVPYRGQRGALFKRDYGRLFSGRFPNLKLLETGRLEDGWDNVTYWMFEK